MFSDKHQPASRERIQSRVLPFAFALLIHRSINFFLSSYWLYFESWARNLTKEFDDVYVITGPLFLPRVFEDGRHYVKYEMIGNPPNVSVPTHFFKGMHFLPFCFLIFF